MSVIFVTKATKTGHQAIVSFLAEIDHISTNIRQLEGLLQKMLLLHLFALKILVTILASVDFPLGHCFCPQASTITTSITSLNSIIVWIVYLSWIFLPLHLVKLLNFPLSIMHIILL